MEYDVKSLSYIIIPGKFPADIQTQALHNKAFLYWRNFWNKVFRDNGTNDVVNPDNFWRQDMIALLMNGDQIVAQQLYTIFNLKSIAARNHSYLAQGFNDEFLKKLDKKNIKAVLSMEYGGVMPEWRKSNTGVSLISVLIGLACRFQNLYQTDAALAIARVDNKITNVVADLGGEVIVPGLMMHNTPIDLMAIFSDKAKPHPDLMVRESIEWFWKNRIDLTQNIPIITKKVA